MYWFQSQRCLLVLPVRVVRRELLIAPRNCCKGVAAGSPTRLHCGRLGLERNSFHVTGQLCTDDGTVIDVVIKVVPLEDRDAHSLGRARKEVMHAINITKQIPDVMLPFKGFVEKPGFHMKTVWEAPEMTLAEWMAKHPLGKLPHAEWVRKRLLVHALRSSP
jgi:hypothetical protein